MTGVVVSRSPSEAEGNGDRQGDHHHLAAERNTTQLVFFATRVVLEAAELEKPDGSPLEMRVGVHTGNCMSGIVGTKNLRFCLFGDAMNTAARMEQHARPNQIHASQAAKDATLQLEWKSQGKIEVKGKGLMQTYYLEPRRD